MYIRTYFLIYIIFTQWLYILPVTYPMTSDGHKGAIMDLEITS